MNLETALHILEMKSYSDPTDLKRAFHALAHRYHPDKNPGSDAARLFREAIDSYEYCMNRLDAVAKHFGAMAPPVYSDKDHVFVANLDDIFDDIFGFSKLGRVLGYREPVTVEITLKELLFGGVKCVKLPAYEPCPDCRGAGAANGSLARICRHCFGKGSYEVRTGTGSLCKVCPQCHGRGREMERPCVRCDGYGRLGETRKQEFNVPVASQPGEMLSLSAKDVATGEDREVCVRFRVLPDRIFQIENHDLICEYRMDFSTHHGDCTLNVETPFGIRQVDLRGQARPGDVLTIKKAGLYKNSLCTEQGDLKVVLRQARRGILKRIRDAFRGRKSLKENRT